MAVFFCHGWVAWILGSLKIAVPSSKTRFPLALNHNKSQNSSASVEEVKAWSESHVFLLCNAWIIRPIL
jgi:hypothetical protein